MAIDIASRLMTGLMTDYGLTKEQAAGFVGNLAHESAGFRTLQEMKPLIPGSRGGYGYAQWTGPRRRQFEAWTQQQGLDPASFDANYGFLKYEFDNTPEGRVIERLRGAKTADEAARIAERTFFRPGIPHTASRIQWANRLAGGEVPAQPTTVAQAQPTPRSIPPKNKSAAPTASPVTNVAGRAPTQAPPTPAAPTVARLLGTDQPKVTALLAALADQGNEQQQQQPTDPRQMFAANYEWARRNGWRV